MNNTSTAASYWIQRLNLLPHPEGGYYKETYRSAQGICREHSEVKRDACTSIYYLLAGADYSAFHRLASDEIWYFHQGSPLLLYLIHEAGELEIIELSDRPEGSLSVAIGANVWFAAEVPGRDFTLVSCAVAPGFDFREFEMATREQMLSLYPQHAAILDRLCR